jgi:hypothetical protein
MKMKKVLVILLLISMWINTLAIANAANCAPKFRGDYTVEANCTWPGDYKVFGDIIVGDNTITVPDGRTVGIDLLTQKATFTTGKILFQGSAKMVNTSASWYYVAISYGVWGITNCPSWYSLLTMTRDNYYAGAPIWRPSSWTIYCWK